MLAQAGYDGVERTVTDHGELTLAEGLATLRLRPDADERLLVLARLFLASETVAQEQAASALRPVSLAELPGLVSGDGGGVRALARIEPFEGMLVASDASYRGDDTVLGIGAATRMLRAVTIRRDSTAALDLCTGSGAVALANAEQAEVVVGTDLNARALELASVNAAPTDSIGGMASGRSVRVGGRRALRPHHRQPPFRRVAGPGIPIPRRRE